MGLTYYLSNLDHLYLPISLPKFIVHKNSKYIETNFFSNLDLYLAYILGQTLPFISFI